MKCGVGNSEDAKFCISCGEKLSTLSASPSSLSASIISNAAAAAPAPAPISTSGSLDPTSARPAISDPELRSLKGVGGWLLFFCIALLIIQPVANFFEAAGDPVALVIAFLLSALSITTSIMLILEKPSAFAWLWSYFGVFAAIMVLGLTATLVGGAVTGETGPDAAESKMREVLVMIRGLGFVALWLSYFKRSKRVRATFGRNLW